MATASAKAVVANNLKLKLIIIIILFSGHTVPVTNLPLDTNVFFYSMARYAVYQK